MDQLDQLDQLRQAKRPLTRLAGPYGHPLHPAVVPIPIGAWVLSLVFDLASRFTGGGHAWADAAWWALGVGVLGALAAALLGLLDLSAVPSGTLVFRLGLAHAGLNLAATALFTAGFLLRRGHLADPGGVPLPLIGLSVLALLLLGGGGFLGGELAYRYGVRVADQSTQAQAYAERTTTKEPS
jgi:uncharacterized membrane protein